MYCRKMSLSPSSLQTMHPDLSQGPHMPPHLPPSSMSLPRGPHQMSPNLAMMGGTNPYGPSGPLPPSMTGQMPPGAMGMGGSPLPPRLPNPLNTTQLQQLSAQIKAYRMLARSMTPPEALISIVQGRKPTAAMLGALSRGGISSQPAGMGYHSGGGVPSPIASQAGSGVGGRDSPVQSNINLYPPSPSTSQPVSVEASSSQSKPTSTLAQKHSSASASSPAPNVTLQPGGELPPQVCYMYNVYMYNVYMYNVYM